jgi:hypothetical protein
VRFAERHAEARDADARQRASTAPAAPKACAGAPPAAWPWARDVVRAASKLDRARAEALMRRSPAIPT